MKLSDFDFELPREAIARFPAERRDASRLMALDRDTGATEHRRFSELPALLSAGDVVVLNDSRVLPARIQASKAQTGGKVELLLVEPAGGDGRTWRALAAASKPVREGAELLADGASVRVLRVEGEGFVLVELPTDGVAFAERHGTIPLPPYLERDAEPLDRERYQTVFADQVRTGSVAAPTAGLHFTPELLAELDARGVGIARVTLHVGPGTFLPVRTDDVEAHRMHAERWEVSPEAAARIEGARAAGGRVVAVGTTVTRVLESMPGDRVEAGSGSTSLFIRPGFVFRFVDVLLTNFHLPRSTLLMLVAAFAGRERILSAYREAIREGYRFFSYGDAMVIR